MGEGYPATSIDNTQAFDEALTRSSQAIESKALTRAPPRIPSRSI